MARDETKLQFRLTQWRLKFRSFSFTRRDHLDSGCGRLSSLESSCIVRILKILFIQIIRRTLPEMRAALQYDGHGAESSKFNFPSRMFQVSLPGYFLCDYGVGIYLVLNQAECYWLIRHNVPNSFICHFTSFPSSGDQYL